MDSALHLEVKNPTSQRSCYNVGFTASQLYQTLTSISEPFVRSMHRCTKSRKIQPIRMAMHKSNSFSHRPDRRLQRQGAFRSRSPRPTSEASQPSRPTDTSTLRTQLFRVAASKVPTDLTQLLILLLWTRRQSTKKRWPFLHPLHRHRSPTSRWSTQIILTPCPTKFFSVLTVSNELLKTQMHHSISAHPCCIHVSIAAFSHWSPHKHHARKTDESITDSLCLAMGLAHRPRTLAVGVVRDFARLD